MRLQDYIDISEAPDVRTLETRLVSFANQLDFGIISGALVVEHTAGRVSSFHLGNTPEAFSSSFVSTSIGKRDPVMQRLKRMSVPFIYDRELYATNGAIDLWEQQAAYGYKTGIAVALHLPGNKHFLLGVDRESPLPKSEARTVRMLADLQLAAVHAQDAAVRLFAKPGVALPELTEREIEILRWSKEGKCAGAVGTIMGISERTVHFHVGNILIKFMCESKQHAIVKAMEIGVI